MLEVYRKHVDERAADGLPPLPLDAKQVADLVELIKNPPAGAGRDLTQFTGCTVFHPVLIRPLMSRPHSWRTSPGEMLNAG